MANGDFRPPGSKAEPARKGILRLQTFSALRIRNYRYLWTASSFISTASWV